MHKYITFLIVLITTFSFAQTEEEKNLMGQWKVLNVKIPEDIPQKEAVKFIEDAFTGAVFNFKGNRIFEITYGEKADDRIKELFKINGDNWKLDNDKIKIGTESNTFSSMEISLGTINGDSYFLLPMIALQVEKINDEASQPYKASENISDQVDMPENEITEPQVADIDEKDLVPFAVADTPPLAPECKPKWDAEKQRKCTSAYISKHVMRKFNTNLASDLKLSGKIRIEITFTIDKTGQPININANSQYDRMNQHIVEVISKLPKFIPSEHNNETVDVSYMMPLVFFVAD